MLLQNVIPAWVSDADDLDFAAKSHILLLGPRIT